MQIKKICMEQLKNILVAELQNFFANAGFSKAVLGLSGGIDSALVLSIAVDALGKDNILAVLLPSKYSSEHSVSDAMQMIRNVGCDYNVIHINEIYDSINNTLKPVFKDAPFDITEENIQARIRGILLMAISNKQHRLLLNTSNKSELYVGYGTLYGDLCGSISVIGGLYKTQVYELARYINKNHEIIPENILTKAPSAELHPGQQDSDSLPPYYILDPILISYVDKKMNKEDIIKDGFDKNDVERTIYLVEKSKFKSSQVPPIIQIK